MESLRFDKPTLDEMYNIGAERWGHPNTRKEVRLHYNRAVMFPYAIDRAVALDKVLGGNKKLKILIVGCGSGWIVEIMQDMGYTNCLGTEISEYLNGRKGGNEVQDIIDACNLVGAGTDIKNRIMDLQGVVIQKHPETILSETSLNADSRSAVNANYGTFPDVVITEDMITGLNDIDALALARSLEEYQTAKIYHLTAYSGNHPLLNNHSLASWQELFGPDHSFVERGSWTVTE